MHQNQQAPLLSSNPCFTPPSSRQQLPSQQLPLSHFLGTWHGFVIKFHADCYCGSNSGLLMGDKPCRSRKGRHISNSGFIHKKRGVDQSVCFECIMRKKGK
ncbi:hypothetical protein QOT17_024487 [Balamuthia mandrillaris]